MKKAKVTKVTKMDKKDGYGNTSYIIEFDNGDKGFYSTSNEDQKKFIATQEAEYTIEEKEGKGGKKYYKITTPKMDGGFQKGAGRPAPPEPRIQMISFAMAYAKDIVVAGKHPVNEIGKLFTTIYNEMISKL